MTYAIYNSHPAEEIVEPVYAMARKFYFDSTFNIHDLLDGKYIIHESVPDLKAFADELKRQEEFFEVIGLEKTVPYWFPRGRAGEEYLHGNLDTENMSPHYQILKDKKGRKVCRTAIFDTKNKSCTLQFLVLNNLYDDFLEMFCEDYFTMELPDKDLLEMLTKPS